MDQQRANAPTHQRTNAPTHQRSNAPTDQRTNGTQHMIGKFEELTLLALVRAGPESHAAKVYNVLEQSLPKVPQFAALYTALDRMAKKGLVSEKKSDDDPRNKRLFTITGEGRAALHEAVDASCKVGAFDLLPAGA